MTAILRDASRKMHHGILFDRRLVLAMCKQIDSSQPQWNINFQEE